MEPYSSEIIEMSEDDKKLWHIAYAAAFVAEYQSILHVYESSRPHPEDKDPLKYYPTDKALRSMSAENAASVADAAVVRLKQWRKDEDPAMGVVIDWPDYREHRND
jgi:hypothetical protein